HLIAARFEAAIARDLEAETRARSGLSAAGVEKTHVHALDDRRLMFEWDFADHGILLAVHQGALERRGLSESEPLAHVRYVGRALDINLECDLPRFVQLVELGAVPRHFRGRSRSGDKAKASEQQDREPPAKDTGKARGSAGGVTNYSVSFRHT